MAPILPGIRVQERAAQHGSQVPSRRSFLRYTGASAALGSVWLASCTKKEDAAPTAAALTITGFSPASGMPGATVTLTGTGFTGATSVSLGTVTAVFVVVSATTITFTVPATAQTGAIVVTAPAGTATTASTFTVVPAPASAPAIASFAPASALPGTTVTVTGTNFTGTTALTVGGVAAVPTVVNATTVTFVVPATAQTGPLVITTPSGTGTSATALTVLPTVINVGTGDIGVLNYAYALEQLEAAFYAKVILVPAPDFKASEVAYLTQIAVHEAIHRDLFRVAIASGRISDALVPDFSKVDFTSRANVLGAAKAFEDLGVAAYNGVARYISSPAYLQLAGKIVSVEARHAAYIRDLLTPGSFAGDDVVGVTTGLDGAMSPTDVANIVNTFLAIGSKLDVSGIK